jgi:hypothetical protein
MPISGRSNPQSAFAAQESPRFRRNIAAIGDARVSLKRRLSRIRRRGEKVARAAKGFDGRTCLAVTMWMDHSQSLLV